MILPGNMVFYSIYRVGHIYSDVYSLEAGVPHGSMAFCYII